MSLFAGDTPCTSIMLLNMILLITLFATSILIPLFQFIFLDKNQKKFFNIQEMFLRYTLFFNIGCLFMLGFAGQLIYAKEIADCLNWGSAGITLSPFQYELSFSELSLSILGLISGLFNYQFWLATIIASVIWLLGASGVHIFYDIYYSSNIISNGAFVVYWNIFIALWILGLYVWYIKKGVRPE